MVTLRTFRMCLASDLHANPNIVDPLMHDGNMVTGNTKRSDISTIVARFDTERARFRANPVDSNNKNGPYVGRTISGFKSDATRRFFHRKPRAFDVVIEINGSVGREALQAFFKERMCFQKILESFEANKPPHIFLLFSFFLQLLNLFSGNKPSAEKLTF